MNTVDASSVQGIHNPGSTYCLIVAGVHIIEYPPEQAESRLFTKRGAFHFLDTPDGFGETGRIPTPPEKDKFIVLPTLTIVPRQAIVFS